MLTFFNHDEHEGITEDNTKLDVDLFSL